MLPCKTSPSPTPLQLTISDSVSLSSWRSSLDRLSKAVRAAGVQGWQGFEDVRTDLEIALNSLEYEGEVSAAISAKAAIDILDMHFRGGKARLAKALASAEQAIGRQRFLAVFELDRSQM